MMVSREKPPLKRIPTANQTDFIYDANKILNKKIKAPDEIKSKNKTLETAAKELLIAYTEDGETGFHKVLEVLVRDGKVKREWIKPITDIPAPDDGESAQEEEQDEEYFVKSQDGKRLLKLFSIEDMFALGDPIHLIEGIFDQCGLSLIFGTSGTGKTFTCLDIALTVAHGLPWHGRDVVQGPAWYINTEGKMSLKKRLRAWYIEHDTLTPTDAFKVIPWAISIRENYQELIDTIKASDKKPALLVIDNFSMVSDANQNLQEEVSPILKLLNDLAQQENFHILLVHHTNKQGDTNGSMAFRNHVDVKIELVKQEAKDPHSPIIFRYDKARDAEPFADIRTELKSVQVYINAKTLTPITSCVVVDCLSEQPEEETPQVIQQMLQILQAHGSLTCAQWLKHCGTTYEITERTFYRYKKDIERDEHITTTGSGRGTQFTLTEKGRGVLE